MRLAVWKFASCDGCQLSLLDCEDELLVFAEHVDIAYFPEASSKFEPGPYDVSLIEGSITTAHDARRVQEIRAHSDCVVTLGACATAGGIQALRNFADVSEYIRVVYARPEYVDTLSTSTPIADHIAVDYELRGCPVDKYQLLGVLSALLAGRKPNIPSYSVCEECKRSANPCLMVASQVPCLGPVTQAGCGALCPTYHRGCYGCFGPAQSANVGALVTQLTELGMSKPELERIFQTFNANAEGFRKPLETGVTEVSRGD